MVQAIQKITLSPARDIPFDKLVLSQQNVRGQPAGALRPLRQPVAQRRDRTVEQAHPCLAHADQVARSIGFDMVEAGWAPTVDNYLARVTKVRILQAVREAKGEQ